MTLDDVRVHLVDDIETAFECKRWLSTCDRVALDTESTGLDKDYDRARIMQLGDARQSYVIPLEYPGWGGFALELLDRYRGRYVLHNMVYDDAMLYNALDVRLPEERCDDTRLKAHVISSTGSLALKKLAVKHVDKRAQMFQDQLGDALGTGGGWTWATVPVNYEPYWSYAGMDTILTYQLDDYLDPIVRAEAPASYDLELAVAWVCERMERKGALIDRTYVETFTAELQNYVAEAERWCRRNYGIYPGSNREVINYFLAQNYPFTKYTDGGQISIDKDVLAAIDHPLAEVVLNRRRAQKMSSTYLSHYLNECDVDGRIHPSINTVGGTGKNPFEPGGGQGVRTGRMSSSNPNIQNVPIRGVMSRRIRRSFIAAPNHNWVKCDADQIEMRGMAHMSNDQGMIDAFNSDGDFFVNIARNIFKDPNFQKSDPRRQLVKNGGYAKIFGAGTEKFAETAGVSEQVAAEFMRDFDAMYPGVPRWIRQVEREARGRLELEGEAYVRSPLTNRKHVADSERKLYPLVNYVIQGTAGEILKMKIVEADRAGLGSYMLFPVHDEIDFEVPHNELDDFQTTLKDVVNDDQLLSVPLTWSAEVGTNWGDCS
jgi:DNA polymerase I